MTDDKSEAIRNAPSATMPADVINTHAEQIRIMVANGPDRTLVMSLHLTLPPPLGDMQVFLGREQILMLHDHLVDLLSLNDEQTELLVARLNDEVP